MPQVSIIIPVYGVEKYIEQCARSLFEQTLDDIEYLFINDCTPDKSVEILKRVLNEYPNRIPQVRIIEMPTNSGQAAVRVRGIQEATGEYIIHCDSDDWVRKDMYELLYCKAVEENADCVICNSFVANGNELKLQTVRKVDNLLDAFFEREISNVLWNKLYKRSLVLPLDLIAPYGNMGEDIIINIQYALNCSKVVYCDEALYYYRVNQSSICNTITKDASIKRFQECIKNIGPLESWIRNNDLTERYNAQFLMMKSRMRDWLVPYIMDKECFHLWKHTYPDLNKAVLTNHNIPVWFKLKIILATLRIPYLKVLYLKRGY